MSITKTMLFSIWRVISAVFVECQSRVRSEGGRGGQDRAYTVQCRGLPMTTNRRREWTEGWEREDEKGDRYSD